MEDYEEYEDISSSSDNFKITRDDWDNMVNLVNSLADSTEDTNKNLDKLVKLNRHKVESESKKSRRGTIIAEESTQHATMRVREYNSTYTGDIHQAPAIYFAQELGGKLRRLEIELNNGRCSFEGRDFQSSSGNLEFGKLPLNVGSTIAGLVRKNNDEAFFQPVIAGTGLIEMRSSLKFIQLLRIKSKTKLIFEKGLYLASISSDPRTDFKFGTEINTKVSSFVFSKKNAIQTSLVGQGIIALELPVHKDELSRHRVTPESPYKVNGDYVLYTVGNLKRSYEKSASLFGSIAGGTGLVEVYRGNGEVITAPTLGYYGAIVESMEGKELQTSAEEKLDNHDLGKNNKGWLSRFLGH